MLLLIKFDSNTICDICEQSGRIFFELFLSKQCNKVQHECESPNAIIGYLASMID